MQVLPGSDLLGQRIEKVLRRSWVILTHSQLLSLQCFCKVKVWSQLLVTYRGRVHAYGCYARGPSLPALSFIIRISFRPPDTAFPSLPFVLTSWMCSLSCDRDNMATAAYGITTQWPFVGRWLVLTSCEWLEFFRFPSSTHYTQFKSAGPSEGFCSWCGIWSAWTHQLAEGWYYYILHSISRHAQFKVLQLECQSDDVGSSKMPSVAF